MSLVLQENGPVFRERVFWRMVGFVETENVQSFFVSSNEFNLEEQINEFWSVEEITKDPI